MTAIYITLAVLAYLLIASALTGVMIRWDKEMKDDCWVGIIGWPCLLLLIIPVVLIPVVLFLLFVKLTKRIGGVK